VNDAPLYFDHNATTPLLPEVVEAMVPFLTTHFGNPSSGHAYGRVAKAAVDRARAQVGALVDAEPEEVVFTGGGTEATRLALEGTLVEGAHVITSRVEHPATAKLIDGFEARGVSVTRLGVDARGLINPAELAAAVRPNTRWISLIHAHNETGVLQPLASLTRPSSVLLHADASQSAGKVPLSLKRDGVELITLAAHKLYGPKGVGALIAKRGVELHSVTPGAGQERGRRAGTENVASIVGFGVACEVAKRDLSATASRMSALRDRLERGLRSAIPDIHFPGLSEPVLSGVEGPVEERPGERPHGRPVLDELGQTGVVMRLPNTTYAVFPRVIGAELLARTPGVAASTGSACHDGQEHAAQVLLEMGIPSSVALGAVRLTLGRHTTEADVDAAVSQLVASWRALT
jgi:cysteine desulfurase